MPITLRCDTGFSRVAVSIDATRMDRIARSRFSLWLLSFLGAGVPNALAQCAPVAVRSDPFPGVIGSVFAATPWDPDGTGPLPPRIVVGGDFQGAGDTSAVCIASVDPATGQWSTMGDGFSFTVWALTTMQNGDVVAGGYFGFSGPVATNSVARWNGSTWLPMGGGLPGGVTSLFTRANGDVIAGGPFGHNLARWDGTGWQLVGTPPYSYGMVSGIAEATNGDLLVAAATEVYRYDGIAWSKVGGTAGSPGFCWSAPAELPGGDIVVGTSNGVMRWNGVTWQPYGPPLGGSVRTVHPLPAGDMVIGGDFAVPGTPSSRGIAYGNGVGWLPIGLGADGTRQLLPRPNGDVYVVGTFREAGGLFAPGIARWSSGSWSPLGPPSFDRVVSCLSVLANGDLIAGGYFARAPGVAAGRIARWNGAQWSAIGAGFNDGFVAATAELGNGDLVAAGYLPTGSGTSACVMRWDGVAWSVLGSISGGAAMCAAVMPGGDLVVGGYFSSIAGQAATNVARWDGTSWHAMGSLTSTSVTAMVERLLVRPNGELLAAGWFDTASGTPAQGIARWNGTTWVPFGTTSPAPVHAAGMACLANGDVVVRRGAFIERWTGTQWAVLGTVSGFQHAVLAMMGLPDGDLLIGAEGVSGVGEGIARFDGTNWTLAATTGGYSPALALATLPDGTVAAGGSFVFVDGKPSPSFLRLVPTCPATNVPFGTGCAGSGGNNSLQATSLPWIGATWSVRASGVAANAFAVRVLGFATQQIPLLSALPQAGAGCDLLATTDGLEIVLAAGGVAMASLAIPDALPLVGTVLHQQMIPFELNSAGDVVQITATNGVRGTIGAF